MLAAHAAYKAAKDDPVRHAMQLAWNQAEARRRQRLKRHEAPALRGVESEARQRRRLNARPRQLLIARDACCPDNILGLDKLALDNSQPFHVGVLGGCHKCHAVGCSCVERFVCTHCGY